MRRGHLFEEPYARNQREQEFEHEHELEELAGRDPRGTDAPVGPGAQDAPPSTATSVPRAPHTLRASHARAPSDEPPPPRPPPLPGISARDDAILRAVARFHFVTAQQITRLFYQPGSLEYARNRLRRLAAQGYLVRLRLPSAGPGNTPWVYSIAGRGWGYLQAVGADKGADPSAGACLEGGEGERGRGRGRGPESKDKRRFRPSEQGEHSWLFLTHTLAVTDVLIAATLLAQAHAEDIVLTDVVHERELRRRPLVKVHTLRGESVGVVPDAWLDFALRAQARMSIVLELDRGTTEQLAMKRKLRALLAYADGPYQQTFQSTSLSIAVATTAGEGRARQLRAWCEDVLRDLPTTAQRQADAELFLFTALPPVPIGNSGLDPERLFLAPVWWQPFADQPISLLDLHGLSTAWPDQTPPRQPTS